MGGKRFVVEGEWGGYRGDPSVCHRRVYPERRAKRYAAITSVQFTDGTSMRVTVRPAEFREKVKQIDGYSTLLNKFLDAGMTGYVRVADLPGLKGE